MDNLITKFNNLKIDNENKSAIVIQKYFRGYLQRKNNAKLSDNVNFDIMNEMLSKYIDNMTFTEYINKKLSNKKCRYDNFPSQVSENIVKFAIYKKYKIMPNWDIKGGDLFISICNKMIEVKAFMSDGPSSFGPSKNWNWIYFVDAKDCKNGNFIVYEIKLSNKSNIWRNIELSKKSGTYGKIADENKRGLLRGCFYDIFKPQLDKKNCCKIIFNGNIRELQPIF